MRKCGWSIGRHPENIYLRESSIRKIELLATKEVSKAHLMSLIIEKEINRLYEEFENPRNEEGKENGIM